MHKIEEAFKRHVCGYGEGERDEVPSKENWPFNNDLGDDCTDIEVKA